MAAPNSERHALFARQVLAQVPLIASIRRGLEQDPSGDLHESLFLNLLHFTLNEFEARQVLRIAIAWGRYGEVFEYDYSTGIVRLPACDTDQDGHGSG